jgi:adenylate cyclase
MWKNRSPRLILSLLLTLLFLVLPDHGPLGVFLNRLEAVAYDLRLRATLPGDVDTRLVIVDIDERSLREQGRWPWNRKTMARLLNQLFDRYNVSLVGFDVVFAEEDRSSGLDTLERLRDGPLKDDPAFRATLESIRPTLEYDRLMAEALRDRLVVLGYTAGNREGVSGALPEPVIGADALKGMAIPFPRPKGFNGNLPALQQAAGNGGFFDNPLVDEDGVYRRSALFYQYQGALYESLALAMARTLLGHPPVRLEVETTEVADGIELGLEWVHIGNQRIPVNEQGGALVPYRSRAHGFPYVSATDVLEGRADEDILAGSMILVGSTAPGLMDQRATPVQNIFPGVEIHANLVMGILDQTIKQRPAFTQGAEFLALLTLGLIISLLFPFLSPLNTIAATLLLLGLTTAINLYAWEQNLVLPLARQLLLIVVLFMLHVAYGYFVEARAKRRLGRQFGQYVPPEIVDEMSRTGGDFALGGEAREMSVLFSDVRGFTSISEGLDPQELTHLMNAFLTPITEVIHQRRGTIDKYMGDAVMAFWGAPLNDPQHAAHAVHAALEMHRRLEQVNDGFERRGWPRLQIGVGINTGEMNVGNMGSEFRMAYTVMGDAVNLASRLEGLTKQYGVGIIVSESTRRAVDDVEFRELDRVRVKGKEEPVAIFQPLAEDDPARASLFRYRTALDAYRRQHWREAREVFTALAREEPDCLLYSVYLQRIKALEKDPPGDGWDAVFVHTTK